MAFVDLSMSRLSLSSLLLPLFDALKALVFRHKLVANLATDGILLVKSLMYGNTCVFLLR